MLNTEKVKLMTKLAMYENGEGKQYLPVSKYYRTDYIGLALIKNFFLVTLGYGLILLAGLGYFAEYLMENIHKMNLVSLGVRILLGYIAVLVLYSILTYIQYAWRYHKAKKSVKDYYVQLTRLNKMYNKEERKLGRRGQK